MDKFFKWNGEKVEFEPELLGIAAYGELWDRDGTKEKKRARQDFAFIWFMMSRDTENNYLGITNMDKRLATLIEDVYEGKTDPTADPLVVKGLKLYKERNPKNGFEQQADFLGEEIELLREAVRSMDKSAVSATGTLLLKPAEFAKATSEISNMVKEYDNMMTLGIEKRNQDSNIRGGGSVGAFESAASATYLDE